MRPVTHTTPIHTTFQHPDPEIPQWDLELVTTLPSGRFVVQDPGTNDRFLLFPPWEIQP
jgi:hypothetical protein